MTNNSLSQVQDEISKAFRDIENDIGATALTFFVIENLSVAIDYFDAIDKKDFYDQFTNLLILIKNTNPRIAIIIAHFSKIYDSFIEIYDDAKDVKELSKEVKKAIKKSIESIEKEDKMVEEYGISCMESGDTILIHSHSKRVLNIVTKGAKKYSNIKIIVAEQDPEKTNEMINFLHQNKVNFVTVPEYMLSHVENEIDKVFLGSLTLNSEFCFVADSGTTALVSELKDAKIPLYMFISSQKFSLWQSTSKNSQTQNTHKISQEKSFDSETGDCFTYQRIKYIYDKVDAENFDKIVTEKGIFTPSEIKKIYDEKYARYKKWREKHFGK